MPPPVSSAAPIREPGASGGATHHRAEPRLPGGTDAERQATLVEGAKPVFADIGPFDVTIGGPNSFDVAAFLEVHDGGALRDTRAKLRSALPWLAEGARDLLVRDGLDVYLPHVSIAYYNAEADARAVVAALTPHRHDVVARFEVASVGLVAVRLPLSRRGPRYRVEASFPLGDQRS